MPRFPRLPALGAPAVTAITLALMGEPAYAAHKAAAKPAARPAVHRAAPTRAPLTKLQARAILIRAARRHGLNPNFVLAVSYWESGWNQAARSRTGAVGMMQVG